MRGGGVWIRVKQRLEKEREQPVGHLGKNVWETMALELLPPATRCQHIIQPCSAVRTMRARFRPQRQYACNDRI